MKLSIFYVLLSIWLFSTHLLWSVPQILSVTIAYQIENAYFEANNLTIENPQNEHLKLKFYFTDTSFSIKIIPHVPISLKKFNVKIQTHEYQKFFSNGFQSWTLTKWYSSNEKVQTLAFPFKKWALPYGDYGFYYAIAENKENPRSHFFTILEKKNGIWDFYSSMNDELAYTIFERINNHQLLIHKDVEGLELNKPIEICKIYFNFSIQLSQIQNFFAYLFPKDSPPSVTGWTSWYNYYTKINENIVLEHIDGFYHNRLSIDYIQIDDGWQEAVGDWTPNSKFSQNLKYLTEDIHKRNFKAGLWVAPFIVEKNSSIYKHRKDWLVYKPNSKKLLKVGYNPLWSGFFKPAFYALDIYHPEVQVYLKNTFKRIVNHWKFDLLKLDFLYAVATVPRNGKTRAMIMHDAIHLLNTWKLNAKLLGCGVPLSPAFHQFDYCRIGPDIGLRWDTKWMKKIKNLERISTFNAIHNTINRALLNGILFGNDPDVSILRTTNNHLKTHQKKTLFYVNNLLGSLNFISDNPIEWTDSILNLYQMLFPTTSIKLTNWNENNNLYSIRLNDEYLLVVNLSKNKYFLEVLDSLVFEGVNHKILKKGDEILLNKGECILLQKIDTEQDISFVGSIGYILPGKEIEAIASDLDNQSISVSFNPKMKVQKFWLKIPNDWNKCTINGKNATLLTINGIKIAVCEF